MKYANENSPPINALRAWKWADLPDMQSPQRYQVRVDGDAFEVTLSKHMRQVIEALINAPLYSASFCRISDQVNLLREKGVDIETYMYRNDPLTGRKRYGVYFLKCEVTPINREVAA